MAGLSLVWRHLFDISDVVVPPAASAALAAAIGLPAMRDPDNEDH